MSWSQWRHLSATAQYGYFPEARQQWKQDRDALDNVMRALSQGGLVLVQARGAPNTTARVGVSIPGESKVTEVGTMDQLTSN